MPRYSEKVIEEIKVISVQREKDSTGQQVPEKKRKVDWTEIEAIAAWIGLGFVAGFIASTIFTKNSITARRNTFRHSLRKSQTLHPPSSPKTASAVPLKTGGLNFLMSLFFK